MKPNIFCSCLLMMSLSFSIFAKNLGGSGAHGGNFKEMQIQNLGWSILGKLRSSNEHQIKLESFEEKLLNLNIEIVDELYIEKIRRDAANIPAQNLWYLTDNAFDFMSSRENPIDKRVQFFMHEFLPLMGQLDKDYQKSRRVAELFKKNETHEKVSRVLYINRYGYHFNGISLDNAESICEQVKREYKTKFFVVYCLYQEKYSKRYYTTFMYSDIYYADRFSEYEERRFRYTRRPVLTGPIYGLKVVGFGPVGSLRERVILDGRTDDMPVYRSRSQARFECGRLVALEDDRNFLYYKAKCKVFKNEGGYQFKITTKNPIAKRD